MPHPAHTLTGDHAPSLPGMDGTDILKADVWATGLSPDDHPIRHLRDRLIPINHLASVPDKTRVVVGGIVRTGNGLPPGGPSASAIDRAHTDFETGSRRSCCCEDGGRACVVPTMRPGSRSWPPPTRRWSASGNAG